MRIAKSVMALLILSFAFTNCSKEDGTILEPDPVQEGPIEKPESPKETVVLESIAPLQGPKGTLVTITGKNFGTDTSKVTVLINEKEMPIVSMENIKIRLEVLSGTLSGAVEIRFGTESFFLGTFFYEVTATVTTLAGSVEGRTDGIGPEARFDTPRGITLDGQGDLYVADSGNSSIRKISPDGAVMTYTGNGCGFENGRLEAATFCAPYGIFRDTDGSFFVADTGNDAIRKIDVNGNVFIAMRDFDNGTGETERINKPVDYARDSNGNSYIVDPRFNRVLKRTAAGIVIVIGKGSKGDVDGSLEVAKFNEPRSLVIDKNDNVYVVDGGNHKIRKISPDGMVSTLAGGGEGDIDGPIEQARFTSPMGLAIDEEGTLYISEGTNNKIKKISPDGLVTTLAGGELGQDNGIGEEAQFQNPYGLAVNPEGTLLYVADSFNHRIRKIVLD